MFDREPEFIPPSDEVVAYPRVLNLLRTNWWEYALSGKSEGELACTMAALYTDEIREAMTTCNAIALVSGMGAACERRMKNSENIWPK